MIPTFLFNDSTNETWADGAGNKDIVSCSWGQDYAYLHRRYSGELRCAHCSITSGLTGCQRDTHVIVLRTMMLGVVPSQTLKAKERKPSWRFSPWQCSVVVNTHHEWSWKATDSKHSSCLVWIVGDASQSRCFILKKKNVWNSTWYSDRQTQRLFFFFLAWLSCRCAEQQCLCEEKVIPKVYVLKCLRGEATNITFTCPSFLSCLLCSIPFTHFPPSTPFTPSFPGLPIFIKTPEDQTGISGGVASFVCQATGEPKPRITWMKKGKKVSSQRFEVGAKA